MTAELRNVHLLDPHGHLNVHLLDPHGHLNVHLLDPHGHLNAGDYDLRGVVLALSRARTTALK